MFRRTKIVTTLGPATDRDDNLRRIIAAGANVVRLNFSHGAPEDHKKRADDTRAIAKELGVHVAVLGDLQGPKIRISTFKDNKKVELTLGQAYTLDGDLQKGEGDENQVGIDYKKLPQDVALGDILMLDDGRVQLRVEKVDGNKVHTIVTVAGPLSNNKGINKQGGGLSAAALTEKDKRDIITAAQINVDYLAVSFPRSGEDLNYARELAQQAGSNALIVSKVERAEAVVSQEAMDDVILASDAVMVARGDLGVEIGDPALVAVQKKLISRSRQLNKPVITATQMMESMITSPMPTRAEVMDVANAVLDGTDAVMLSAETAAGDFPEETVKAMAQVCIGAEAHPSVQVSKHRLDEQFTSIDETIALSTMYAANHLDGVKAIIALTESGATPQIMSRISSGLPIFALSRHTATLAKMALYRGVHPIYFDSTAHSPEAVAQKALDTISTAGYLNSGDMAMMTKGDAMETVGGTNTSKVVVVA
ncbi:pyruvate kinase [Shewanella youngdeokensis]|uniref:Pyruvate kinase n=1 Tax=Shewanella youngdeokensis TaxID=2999068 RepID=A0ABZ0K2C3_9GAMM|nr:pyruvate kinase [Shewanella sp. DAU334]